MLRHLAPNTLRIAIHKGNGLPTSQDRPRDLISGCPRPAFTFPISCGTQGFRGQGIRAVSN